MSGNLVIVTGLVLIAIGGFLGFYGAQLNSRADNAQASKGFKAGIDKVLNTIASVKQSVAVQGGASGAATPSTTIQQPLDSEANKEAEKKLSNIEQDFSQWASDFIKNRDLKKLDLERQKLDARSKELEISKKYRPLLQYTIDVLKRVLQAYNATASAAFDIRLSDLPNNLYAVDTTVCEIGTVEFGSGVKWHVYVIVNKPADERNSPYFQIDIQDPRIKTSDVFRIEPTPPNFTVHSYGGGIAGVANKDTVGPLSSFESPIREIVQRLVETQISSLPTP
ncbi:MAG TPA: hypothetical protein DCK99_21890 [Blastocatellia bacterium]|nr:hypothetical protein [Blastocatellia bacterium]